MPIPDMQTRTTMGKKNKRGIGMGMLPATAEAVFFWANWALLGALVLGVAATYAITISGRVRDFAARLEIAELNRVAESEKLARVKLEAKIAPRSLTQAQQEALTATLTGLERQTGTVMASPSLPESEWFARVLTAPLRAAGWDMTPVNGTATATMLQPTGVVIQYAIDLSVPLPDQLHRSVAASRLASELNAMGIDATAVPGLITPPATMAIVITPK
jgi:hypothetical protein